LPHLPRQLHNANAVAIPYPYSTTMKSKHWERDRSFAVKLMQDLVVPTFVLDAACHVIIWNRACERLTGLAAHEVMGTREHWRAFYDVPRPCLADLVAQGRTGEIAEHYASFDKAGDSENGFHAQNWCVMPQLGRQYYLAIDAGPIYGANGELIAVVETLRDMTEQKQAQIALERLAACDGLTGIANRRSFDEKLGQEWLRARRDKTQLALLMLDVDHFKLFNDRYGHQAGDVCLRRLAECVAAIVLRPGDLVARYGGEEFAVVLPSIDADGALQVAQRVREAVRGLAIPHVDSVFGVVTVSVGVACAVPSQGSDHEALVKSADIALYQAKHAGRDRVALAPLLQPDNGGQ
jgi:diguanylate cyclase (GGDEF)-like protein/PAS domain S-box-containing protein